MHLQLLHPPFVIKLLTIFFTDIPRKSDLILHSNISSRLLGCNKLPVAKTEFMNNKYFFLLCTGVMLIFQFPVIAQPKFTISGTITSKAKGETIIGATIRIGSHTAISNDYGFYSVTVAKGEYTIEVSAVGLQTFSQKIIADRNHCN